MERVSFLLEDSGERLDCQLNPESVAIRRRAGILRRHLPSGAVSSSGQDEDALVHTGGGRTEIELELLFDLDLLMPSQSSFEDVSQMTEPFFALTRLGESRAGKRTVPAVRMIWGSRWNRLVIFEALSERLEQFDVNGFARRSWLRARMLQLPETVPARVEPILEDSDLVDHLEDFDLPVAATGEDAAILESEENWTESLPGGLDLAAFLEELGEQAVGDGEGLLR